MYGGTIVPCSAAACGRSLDRRSHECSTCSLNYTVCWPERTQPLSRAEIRSLTFLSMPTSLLRACFAPCGDAIARYATSERRLATPFGSRCRHRSQSSGEIRGAPALRSSKNVFCPRCTVAENSPGPCRLRNSDQRDPDGFSVSPWINYLLFSTIRMPLLHTPFMR